VKLNRMNILLASLLLLVALLTAATRVDHTRPNIEILPHMKYSPARAAYSRNSVFANGRTLQASVPGTIARGQLPLHYEATADDAIRAGEELTNPYHPQDEAAADAARLAESIQRGGETFRVFCVCCHGPTGGGDGPVTTRGFPPPPSLLTGKSRQMKDGQLFHLLTYGQANMPSFSAQLERQRRWDVINYLRSLQTNAGPPGEGLSSSSRGDPSGANAARPADAPVAPAADAPAAPAADAPADADGGAVSGVTVPPDGSDNSPERK